MQHLHEKFWLLLIKGGQLEYEVQWCGLSSLQWICSLSGNYGDQDKYSFIHFTKQITSSGNGEVFSKSNKSKVWKWKFVSEKDIFPAASVFDICQRSTWTKVENIKFYQLFWGWVHETNWRVVQFFSFSFKITIN